MLLAARPTQMGRLYAFAVDRLAPVGLRPKIHGLFDRFIFGLQSLRSPREMATILLTSILIWLVETLKYWFVMHAFEFSVSFPVLMLLTAVVNLTTTIPSTPGYVGTFHLPGIAILTQFGVAQAVATGYMVVLHAALWLPITLLGAFFMLRQSIGWNDMARAAQIKAQQEDPPPAVPADADHDEVVRGVSP
jgi:glycosyltransferase 2 family protein